MSQVELQVKAILQLGFLIRCPTHAAGASGTDTIAAGLSALLAATGDTADSAGAGKPGGRRGSLSRVFTKGGAGAAAATGGRRRSIAKVEGKATDSDHETAIAQTRETLYSGLLFLAAVHPVHDIGVQIVNKVRFVLLLSLLLMYPVVIPSCKSAFLSRQ